MGFRIVNKVFASHMEAVADIPDGATVMIGGFGIVGDQPDYLTLALRDHGAKNLTIIANTPGTGVGYLKFFGIDRIYIDNNYLIENRQVKKFMCSIT
jgi:acyl CoA:acetate/3-ketoacid CoA transferase alpha subunit